SPIRRLGMPIFRARLQQGFATDKMGFRGSVCRAASLVVRMSAPGHERRFGPIWASSALPSTGDIEADIDFRRNVPGTTEVRRSKMVFYSIRLDSCSWRSSLE